MSEEETERKQRGKKEKEREEEARRWTWCVFDIFPSSLTTSNWEQTTPTTTPVERFACVRKRVGEVRVGGKGGRACWREVGWVGGRMGEGRGEGRTAWREGRGGGGIKEEEEEGNNKASRTP